MPQPKSPDVHTLIETLHSSLRLSERPDPETPLLSSGIVDSFDVVILIAAIEDEFTVVVDPGDISIDTFDTPNQMVRLLQRKAQSEG